MSMQSILSASLSLTRVQTMQSVTSRTQGQINVLQAEIKLDNGNAAKEAKVEELQEKMATQTGNMMDELNDVQETLKPSEDTENKTEKPSETEKEPNTDKVDLSHKPDGESSGETAAVTGESVSYDAGGKTTKAAQPSGQKVDAKA